MIKIKQTGNFKKLDNYLKVIVEVSKFNEINNIAKECVQKLSELTPKDTGKTASSWVYDIGVENGKQTLRFSNTNVVDGANIALLIDIGHLSEQGIWIEGVNYIEPIVRDAYNKILSNCWKELIKL